MTISSAGWTTVLASHREQLRVGSTAQRVVALLRDQVLDGQLLPGTQLIEEPLVEALGVSRNTVREALSLLATERLVEHRRHRGMFVRRLGRDDLADVCGLRRSLECGALRDAARLPAVEPDRVQAVSDAAAAGRAALDRQDWTAVGSANSTVHLALAALAGNPRIDEAMASVVAEMRLAFLVLSDPRRMHEPYVSENTGLAALVVDGHLTAAADELDAYLRRAQDHLIEAYSEVVEG